MAGEERAISITGAGRELTPGGRPENVPVTFELHTGAFVLGVGGRPPTLANYRDATTIAVDGGRLLLVLGDEYRLLVEQLGDGLATLLGALRERRARQLLDDRFIEIDSDAPIELVEYRAGDEHGVAQIAYHPWGVALLPLDERRAWHLVRRADIADVTSDRAHGSVEFQAAATRLQLPALGEDAERHRAHLAGLRDAARADAAAIIAALMPDAPFAARQRAAGLLIDGRPISPDLLGDAWPLVQRAVLTDPGFAQTYAALVGRGSVAGQAAPQWLAVSPASPGAGPDDARTWFFVGLPGNLVAMELVQVGTHATYLFRIVARAGYAGQPPVALAEQLRSAVGEISDCLVDTRFLREPIYLTDAALQDARYLRYRLAIAALPALSAARARFVGRLIHRDGASWAAGLEDAIRWNGASRDDQAVWPGGAAGAAEDSADQSASEGT